MALILTATGTKNELFEFFGDSTPDLIYVDPYKWSSVPDTELFTVTQDDLARVVALKENNGN